MDVANNSMIPFYHFGEAFIDQTERNQKGATAVFTHEHKNRFFQI
jgi:hypothetical protein